MDRWLEALEKEMELYEGDFGVFDSLYIGGGTPTVLEPEQIGRLFEAIRRHFGLAADTEITVEANPDDMTSENLDALRVFGVNRLSIGVQSFNDEELNLLQRRHTAERARKAVELARELGFSNIGVDLMFGLPWQTKKSWLDTLEKAIGLEPAHLSCYQFTLEERTPYGKLKAEGKLTPIGEERERALFLLTSRFLGERGFIHYEVSNFAKDPTHFSRHNRKYWQHVPYLGLGPAAHSFRENSRWWNCRSVQEYCSLLDRGARPVEGREDLSGEQLRLERLYLGFRTNNGVSMDDVCLSDASMQTLSRLRRSGFLQVVQGRAVPTPKGFLIADRLPLIFDADQ